MYEVQTDLKKAREVMKAANKEGGNLSLLDAYWLTMELKITREGRGFVIPGLSRDLREIIAATLGRKQQ